MCHCANDFRTSRVLVAGPFGRQNVGGPPSPVISVPVVEVLKEGGSFRSADSVPRGQRNL